MSRSWVWPSATRALKAAWFVHVIERHCPFEQNLLFKKHRAGCLGCSPSTTRFVIRFDSRLTTHGPGILVRAWFGASLAPERRRSCPESEPIIEQETVI